MKSIANIIATGFIMIILMSGSPSARIRKPVDPVGFATRSWQMDSIMKRIERLQGMKMNEALDQGNIQKFMSWKMAISPHDDYTYVGWLYPAVLRNVKTGTVILLGVAHKAKKFNIENRMVFDSYDYWQGPYGPAKVSSLREAIMNKLPRSSYIVHDSLQMVEHSVEAIIPFLQYYNKKIEIVSILIPAMSYSTMKSLSSNLADALFSLSQFNDRDYQIGRDYSIIVSSDAVHYGCEDWGGSDYAFYGCDTAGYYKAVDHEFEIMRNCLLGQVTEMKAESFTRYTLQDTNYHSYKWTWCGRYSVPFGMLTLAQLENSMHSMSSSGTLIGYSTSISIKPIPVSDLKMGTTAKATIKHWVGYPGIGYR
ncbi:MAG: AmmeMemoRadiSam system protein B [Bacteroidetes bacterium]|nr:AmmeMemoRadiSam system protein B [Bacteroidota bacterium]